jgi:hypothetical protein
MRSIRATPRILVSFEPAASGVRELENRRTRWIEHVEQRADAREVGQVDGAEAARLLAGLLAS